MFQENNNLPPGVGIVPIPEKKKRGRPKKVKIVEEKIEKKKEKENDGIGLGDLPNFNEEIKIPLADGATETASETESSVPATSEEETTQENLPNIIQPSILANPPDPGQFEKDVTAGIAKNIGERTANKVIQDAVKKGQLQEKATKTVMESELYESEYINNCIILNAYKTAYEGKINFKFRSKYEPGIVSPVLVKQHLNEVRALLNGQQVPYFIEQMLDKGSEAISRLSVMLAIPWLNLSTFHQNVQTALKTGFFDEEIKQLSIEWMSYLGQDPKTRLLIKLGIVLSNSWMENTPSMLLKRQADKLSKIPQKQAQDLKNKFKDI
jgi:hypothetical protein